MNKVRNKLLGRVAIGALLSVCVGGGAAIADTSAATSASDASANRLPELIVTATRREENVQHVPAAMTTFTAQQLELVHVTSLEDLQNAVPNFTFGGESTVRRPDIALRGIDSGTRVPGFEGSIGFFVDGVYEPFPDQWDNPVVDVSRVEVLYGPQDTLFGKDTIAGAISITTKKPGNTLDGDLTAEYGNYDYYMFKGDVDIPLIDDKLSVRLSGLDDYRQGYIRNIINGQHYNGLDQHGGHMDVRYTPTPNWEFNLSLGAFQDDTAEVQQQTIGDMYSTGNPRTVELNTNPETNRHLYDVTLTGVYTFPDGGTFTSITAGARTRAHYHQDEDSNPSNEWVTDIYDHTTNFSEELRYASPTGRFIDYQVGLYYLNSYWAQASSIQTLAADPQNAVGGLGFLYPDGAIDYSDAVADRVWSNSYAVYGSANVHFTDQWTLSLGGRWSYDDKDLNYPGQPNFGAGFLNLCKLGAALGGGCLIPGGAYPTLPAYQNSLSESAPTGSVSLNYQVTPEALLYAKIDNGFKGGGWNTGLGHSYPPDKFSAEHLVNYEIGEKVDLFDHHLRIDGDLFYDDYANKQETIFVNIIEGFHITNAASAKVSGAEASAALLLGDFTFNASVGLVDPVYNNFECAAGVNCKGQQLVYSTRSTADGSVTWAHQIGNLGKLTLWADVTWRDKMPINVPNAPASTVPSYALLNLRASLMLPDNRTELYVFGKNVTNKTYLISNFNGSPSYPGYGNTSEVLYGPPAMFAFGVTHHF